MEEGGTGTVMRFAEQLQLYSSISPSLKSARNNVKVGIISQSSKRLCAWQIRSNLFIKSFAQLYTFPLAFSLSFLLILGNNMSIFYVITLILPSSKYKK